MPLNLDSEDLGKDIAKTVIPTVVSLIAVPGFWPVAAIAGAAYFFLKRTYSDGGGSHGGGGSSSDDEMSFEELDNWRKGRGY
jgi:hypothetical protein